MVRHIEVSIITVNYHSANLIQKLAASLPTKSAPSYEFIVVDNSVDDEQAEKLKHIKAIDKLLVNKDNLGFGAANNLGFKHAKGEYLLILNPDTRLEKDSLQEMLSAARKVSELGMLGCAIYSPAGKLQRSASIKYPGMWSNTVDNSPLLRAIIAKLNPNYDPIAVPTTMLANSFEPKSLLGACMLIPSEVYKNMNGFDEQFFLYREETDLARRMASAGYKIVYDPTTKIIHISGGASKNTFYPELSPLYTRSIYQFLSRYHGIIYVSLAWLIAFASLIVNIIFYSIFSLLLLAVSKTKARQYRHTLSQVWHGLTSHFMHPFAIGYYYKS